MQRLGGHERHGHRRPAPARAVVVHGRHPDAHRLADLRDQPRPIARARVPQPLQLLRQAHAAHRARVLDPMHHVREFEARLGQVRLARHVEAQLALPGLALVPPKVEPHKPVGAELRVPWGAVHDRPGVGHKHDLPVAVARRPVQALRDAQRVGGTAALPARPQAATFFFVGCCCGLSSSSIMMPPHHGIQRAAQAQPRVLGLLHEPQDGALVRLAQRHRHAVEQVVGHRQHRRLGGRVQVQHPAPQLPELPGRLVAEQRGPQLVAGMHPRDLLQRAHRRRRQREQGIERRAAHARRAVRHTNNNNISPLLLSPHSLAFMTPSRLIIIIRRRTRKKRYYDFFISALCSLLYSSASSSRRNNNIIIVMHEAKNHQGETLLLEPAY